MATIFLLDATAELALCARVFATSGHTCYPFDSIDEILAFIPEERPDLVILNPHLNDGEGIRGLKVLRGLDLDLQIVLYTKVSLFGNSCDYFIADNILVKHPGHTQLLTFVKEKLDHPPEYEKVPFHECFF
jgi:DNA-binding NtrC family response regulator